MPQPMLRGIPIMPAPPLPMIAGDVKLAAPSASPQLNPKLAQVGPFTYPELLSKSRPGISTPPSETSFSQPPGEVLPQPRELNPDGVPQTQPDGLLNPHAGSMISNWDGTPDTAPDCPPNAPRGFLYYGRAEYLMWWAQPQSAPVLLTSGAPPVNLIGGGEVRLIPETRHGGRFTFGRWLNNAESLAIEAVGFFIGGAEGNYPRTSPGSPLLARPFVNGVTGQASQSIVAGPGFPGTVQIGMLSNLWGLEGNGRCELCRWIWGHCDALAGIRYLEFDENLTIHTETRTGPATTNFVRDAFATYNHAILGQLGVDAEIYYRKWFLDAWAKIGLGDNIEQVDIQGNRGIAGRTLSGGLLAQPSNSGRHQRDQFAYVPEFSITAGYQVQLHVRALVGYNFLFLGNVARPGDQIDTRINTTAAGPAVPAFSANQGEFWIQGWTAGVEFRY